MFNEDEGRFCDHSIPNMRRAKCWAKERIGAILGLGWLVAYSIVGCAYHTALKFYKWVDLSCNVMQSSGDLRQICVSLGYPRRPPQIKNRGGARLFLQHNSPTSVAEINKLSAPK